MNAPFIPVILSGGSGSRLWPVSRKEHPKPFMRLADGTTLAGRTLERALRVTKAACTLTVTGQIHENLTRQAYAEVDFNGPHHFLLEPAGRNTAPAIAVAAQWVKENMGGEVIMLVLPSDQLIADIDAFEAACHTAAALAGEGRLVCLGVQPTHPDTGFGYIQRGASLTESADEIARFVEKPDQATAESFLASGDFLWNAGMFCFRADTVLKALERHAPQIGQLAADLVAESADSATAQMLNETVFSTMPSISFDYAVMEKASQRAVAPASCGWSDIGSWAALKQSYAHDDNGNVSTGEAVLLDCENVFASGSKRLIAAVGVKDLVIVETDDAILVIDANQSQDVKKIVEALQEQNHPSITRHLNT